MESVDEQRVLDWPVWVAEAVATTGRLMSQRDELLRKYGACTIAPGVLMHRTMNKPT